MAFNSLEQAGGPVGPARGVSPGVGIWVGEQLGEGPPQARFSQLTGAGELCGPKGLGPAQGPDCTLVLLRPFSGCKGRAEHGAWLGSGGRPQQGREGGGPSSKFKFQLTAK